MGRNATFARSTRRRPRTSSCSCSRQELAPTTIAKRLQFARQFFRAAVKRKLIPSNPFAEVAAKATMNR